MVLKLTDASVETCRASRNRRSSNPCFALTPAAFLAQQQARDILDPSLDPTSYERMIFVRTEQMPPCGETHGNPNSSIPARTDRYNKVRRTITARCSKPSCATCLEI